MLFSTHFQLSLIHCHTTACAKMAELGVAAAVVQLLDSSIKVLGIVSKLRDAPSVTRDLLVHAERLERVVKSIQPHATANSETCSALQECLKDSGELKRYLEKLTVNADGDFLEKSWKAFLAVVKQGKIGSICTKIQGHTTSLALLLPAESL